MLKITFCPLFLPTAAPIAGNNGPNGIEKGRTRAGGTAAATAAAAAGAMERLSFVHSRTDGRTDERTRRIHLPFSDTHISRPSVHRRRGNEVQCGGPETGPLLLCPPTDRPTKYHEFEATTAAGGHIRRHWLSAAALRFFFLRSCRKWERQFPSFLRSSLVLLSLSISLSISFRRLIGVWSYINGSAE